MHTHTFKRKMLMESFKLFDLCMVGLAFIITMGLSVKPSGFFELISLVNIRISVQNIIFFIVYTGICHLVFNSTGFYDSHRLSGIITESFKIGKATVICTGVLIVVNLVYVIQIIDFSFIIIYWVSLMTLLSLSRIMLRSLLRILRAQGRNLRHVLIIGKNARSQEYAQKLMTEKKLGYHFQGFVDIRQRPGKTVEDDTLIAFDVEGFQKYVRKNVVDEIFLFLPIKSFYNELNDIIAICEEQGIVVRMCTDLFKLRFAKAKVEEIGSDALLTLYTGNMNRPTILVKEMIDIVLAALLIITTGPLMLLTALLIKLFSPGPVFFLQDRIGLHKRKFKIIKFRTMTVDAESKIECLAHLNEMGDTGAFKIKNDPRITPFGKILRRLSIDELPQLFNVLKGDMSLIGPRPLTLRDFKGFAQDDQRRRFSVKPGLTCLWQVSGRNKLSFNEWMALDMKYIDNWSLWLDFKILFRTVFAVLKADGAH